MQKIDLAQRRNNLGICRRTGMIPKQYWISTCIIYYYLIAHCRISIHSYLINSLVLGAVNVNAYFLYRCAVLPSPHRGFPPLSFSQRLSSSSISLILAPLSFYLIHVPVLESPLSLGTSSSTLVFPLLSSLAFLLPTSAKARSSTSRIRSSAVM